MANYLIQDSTLTGIANAIRSKTGSSNPILVEDMADEISSISGGGGGGSPVTLTYTEIGNDDSQTGTITFTGDYHDYPLVKFRMVNTSTSAEEEIIITPRLIDDAFSYSNNRLNFNLRGTTIYAYYSPQQNGTWKRGGQRTCVVTKVWGVNSSTHTISVTNLYRYQAITSGNRTITFAESIYDYQYLLIGVCDGDSTETQGSLPWVTVGNPGIEEFDKYHLYYGYGSSTTLMFHATEHGFTAQHTQKYGFFTVDGINFTKI